MSQHSSQDQTFSSTLGETDEVKFERLLKEAGLMKRQEQEIFSPEERVEKIKGLLDLLKLAKEQRDEKGAKKIRRTLRKKFKFSIREHMKVEI
jgi:hypothetical protein